MKQNILILSVIALIFSCKKEKLTQYTEQSRIFFENGYSLYSLYPGSRASQIYIDFAPRNTSLVTDTVKFNIQTTGTAVNEDRPINVTVSSANGQEGTDYLIPDKSPRIPAGAYNYTFRVIMLRSKTIAKNPVTVSLTLAAGDDFQLGPEADSADVANRNSTSKLLKMGIRVQDIVTKPDNWESFIKTYFGTYSETKLRFINDILKRTAFPSNTAARTMTSYKTQLNTALTKYNTAHPGAPLTDENGLPVTF